MGDATIERVSYDGVELAVIIRRSFRKDGIEFFSDHTYSQQLGYMNRPQGYVIPPHVHNPVSREIHYTKEVLLIRSGDVRIDFYSEMRTYLESRILHEGDVILLSHGGHGFEMISDAEMIEVKQGPYTGEHDKTRFDPVPKERIKIVGGGS